MMSMCSHTLNTVVDTEGKQNSDHLLKEGVYLPNMHKDHPIRITKFYFLINNYFDSFANFVSHYFFYYYTVMKTIHPTLSVIFI